MIGYAITKTMEIDVGVYSDPLFEIYEQGSIALPLVDLYFCSRSKKIVPLTSQARESMVLSTRQIGKCFSPDEAMQHILECGRRCHGDDFFYRQIEISDSLIHQVLETQRAIEESPGKLARLVGQILDTNRN